MMKAKIFTAAALLAGATDASAGSPRPLRQTAIRGSGDMFSKPLSLTITLTGIAAGSMGLVQAGERAPADIAAPALSKAQLSDAASYGVDLTKANYRPGLHIVPLAESWNIGSELATTQKQIEQQRLQGFYHAEPTDVIDIRALTKAGAMQRLDSLPWHDRVFHSVDDVRSRLAVTPIGLGNSRLASADMLELRISGGLVNDRWTGLTRTFEIVGLGFVILNETDHAAGRESVSLIEEWINTDVNGSRGTVKTARDDFGGSMVTVGWANERKIVSLRLQPSLPEQTEANQAALLEIARALIES
jgi:hypothetical protein